MNYKQVGFNESQSFHVSRVPEECEVSSIRPVLHSSEDVKRMVEESSRARLISQIVAAPEDYLSRDFAASFKCATRDTDPPQFATSHKSRPEPRRRTTIPTYPSLVQSLRWSPYVEVSSPESSHTNLLEEHPKFNCKCESCSVKNCPSRVSSVGTLKPVAFKDNIMTFSDRCTMTPRLNDACCGVCTPIPTTPKMSDVCVPPEIAVRDTETVTHFPNMYTNESCAPIPILKRPEYSQPACTYGYCGHATGHVPVGIRQEAVRDTDIGEDYCEPIKPKSLKNFFKFKKKHEQPHCMPEYGRAVIYNEGISDMVANKCTIPIPPIRVPSPVAINRESSKVSVRSKTRCYLDNDDGIPYAHRSESRYHHSCKKPNLRPSYHCCDADEVRHLVESPKIVRKTFTSTSRPARSYRVPSISLPRKVLTSEADIESYIDKGRQESNTESQSSRRKRNKK
ncbi:uncharacterized protein LOC114357299 [Ostrinia furnacalis]|uniref:uncharacterized protein LOC114357299 n=1 Tax=Ostrinia furnacalis TaxID=93504 RepID=UPI00103FCE39|nr:uncharacterized protein LOC114357299 [Ostrinia furnacalis]